MKAREGRLGLWLTFAIACSVLVAGVALLVRTEPAPAALTARVRPDFLDRPHRHRALAPDAAPKP